MSNRTKSISHSIRRNRKTLTVALRPSLVQFTSILQGSKPFTLLLLFFSLLFAGKLTLMLNQINAKSRIHTWERVWRGWMPQLQLQLTRWPNAQHIFDKKVFVMNLTFRWCVKAHTSVSKIVFCCSSSFFFSLSFPFCFVLPHLRAILFYLISFVAS